MDKTFHKKKVHRQDISLVTIWHFINMTLHLDKSCSYVDNIYIIAKKVLYYLKLMIDNLWNACLFIVILRTKSFSWKKLGISVAIYKKNNIFKSFRLKNPSLLLVHGVAWFKIFIFRDSLPVCNCVPGVLYCPGDKYINKTVYPLPDIFQTGEIRNDGGKEGENRVGGGGGVKTGGIKKVGGGGGIKCLRHSYGIFLCKPLV